MLSIVWLNQCNMDTVTVPDCSLPVPGQYSAFLILTGHHTCICMHVWWPLEYWIYRWQYPPVLSLCFDTVIHSYIHGNIYITYVTVWYRYCVLYPVLLVPVSAQPYCQNSSLFMFISWTAVCSYDPDFSTSFIFLLLYFYRKKHSL